MINKSYANVCIDTFSINSMTYLNWNITIRAFDIRHKKTASILLMIQRCTGSNMQ